MCWHARKYEKRLVGVRTVGRLPPETRKAGFRGKAPPSAHADSVAREVYLSATPGDAFLAVFLRAARDMSVRRGGPMSKETPSTRVILVFKRRRS
jgi:hypothetical protein